MLLKKIIIKIIRKIKARKYRYNFKKEFKKVPDVISVKAVDNPLVSIVIPVYNQYRCTKLCIWSILKNTEDIEYEIIIGDDCSTDKTIDIQEEIRGLFVSRNKTNLGFLRNVNKASKLARGKYLIIMNNDVYVKNKWLEHLLNTIEEDESVGYVGGKCIESDGLVHEAGCFVAQDAYTGFHNNGELPSSKECNKQKEVDYCSACGVILKKETWDKLNGFDERFCPSYFEDVDLCFEIKHKLGLKIIYQPKSEMYHLHGQTHGRKPSKHSETNRLKFIEKWAHILKDSPYPAVKRIGRGKRLLETIKSKRQTETKNTQYGTG